MSRPIDKVVYIYALTEPDGVTVRYVGQTVNLVERYKKHLRVNSGQQNIHRVNWIRSVLNRGEKPLMIELEAVPPCGAWEEREKYWIAYYRELGFDLTNYSDGGDGPVGFRWSEEEKRRMSEQRRGKKKPPGFGEQIRQVRTGTHLPEKTRAKISERAKRRPDDRRDPKTGQYAGYSPTNERSATSHGTST